MRNRLRAAWNVLRGRPTMYRMRTAPVVLHTMRDVVITDCESVQPIGWTQDDREALLRGGLMAVINRFQTVRARSESTPLECAMAREALDRLQEAYPDDRLYQDMANEDWCRRIGWNPLASGPTVRR